MNDIIIIGAGSAGLNIALFMSRIGLKVLLIEKHLIGGDCLNYGCVPSKALISISKIVKDSKKAKEIGLKVSGKVNMKKVAKLIRERQDVIREHENPEYLRKKGVKVIIGSPKFVSGNSLRVNGKIYSARSIVIATGSRPLIPKIKGIEKIKYFTNENIFKNLDLPKELVVIGGGPIGIELAQAYHNLGSRVTIVTNSKGILPREDEEMSHLLYKHFTNQGIKIITGTRIFEIDGKDIVCGNKGKEKIRIKFDSILIATGRKLNLGGLDVEKAGIKLKDSRLILDTKLRTTNKKVYACGDVAGSYQFTHWAEYQAGVVINNMLSPFKKKVNNKKIAWVTYTDPELSSFGITKEQVKKTKNVKIIKSEIKRVDRAIAEGSTTGMLKLYVKNDRILGGSLLSRNSGEIVGELITAMDQGIKFSKLFERIYPYPTMARIGRKAVQEYLGRKLTPFSMKILRRAFRLLN